MKPYWLILTLGLSACGSTKVFTPRSAYPPDPWAKGYSDPDDCIGGEDLAAIKFDLPAYPKSAFRNGLQGWTIVRLDLTSDGLTDNVRIERSLPNGTFDKASISAVEAWQFRPPEAPLVNCRILLKYQAGAVNLGG